MTKNIEFAIMKKKIQLNSMFRNKLIKYLKNIICLNLRKNANRINQTKNWSISFFNVINLNNDEFRKLLLKNNDIVISTKQKHLINHNVICFKYRSDQKKCRFNMFKNIVNQTVANEHEIIHIQKK